MVVAAFRWRVVDGPISDDEHSLDPRSTSNTSSVPNCSWSLQTHVERDEAVKERRFSIEVPASVERSGNVFPLVLDEAKPKQRS